MCSQTEYRSDQTPGLAELVGASNPCCAFGFQFSVMIVGSLRTNSCNERIFGIRAKSNPKQVRRRPVYLQVAFEIFAPEWSFFQ